MSKLYDDATKNPRHRSSTWENFVCIECGVRFSMRVSYEDGYKGHDKSTKKCNHTEYEAVSDTSTKQTCLICGGDGNAIFNSFGMTKCGTCGGDGYV